jgi:plastocyanin
MRFLLLALVVMSGTTGVQLPQRFGVTGQVEFSSAANRKVDSAGAVVWLSPLDNSAQISRGAHRARLVQKNKTFVPHVLVVPVGTPVDFPNQDPFFHNVFSLFEGKRFDLGLYESGSSRTVVFNRVGISYIFCNIHPEMSAVVISLDTPYFGISDQKGMFVILDVPSGLYQVHVWDERVLPETLMNFARTVTISENSRSLGIVHLPEQRNLSGGHKNKYGQDYEDPARNSPVYKRPPF